jgi:hypothetical protein
LFVGIGYFGKILLRIFDKQQTGHDAFSFKTLTTTLFLIMNIIIVNDCGAAYLSALTLLVAPVKTPPHAIQT